MLDECVVLGRGGGALGAMVVGASDGGPLGVTTDGARVAGGGTGAALVGGGATVVVVIEAVGSTTPVSPNGARDTTVIADMTTATAITPNATTAAAPIQLVPNQRPRGGVPAGFPSATTGYASSGLFNFDGFVSPSGFDSEDEPDPARVVLVLRRCRGVETIGVLRDQ